MNETDDFRVTRCSLTAFDYISLKYFHIEIDKTFISFMKYMKIHLFFLINSSIMYHPVRQ